MSHDCGIIRVAPSSFESARHDCEDQDMIALVRRHAQDALRKSSPIHIRSKVRRTVGDGSPAHVHARRALPDRKACGSQIKHPEKWMRKAPVSLMGLCNRVSHDTFRKMCPKIECAVEAAGDAEKSIDTILACLSQSDSYICLYVDLIARVRGVAGMHDALDNQARRFLDSKPYAMSPAPDPSEDYDSFCAHIKEKRRRRNMVDALTRLGYGPEVQQHCAAAMDLVADPASPFAKDVAIAYLRAATQDSTCKGGVHVLELQSIVRNADAHALDNRCRFALTDLMDALALKST